jgi:hypothetical protein
MENSEDTIKFLTYSGIRYVAGKIFNKCFFQG